jgi:Zn-dependent alcohol dehydrogenase
MIAAALGANPTAIDIATDKLEFAKKLGAVSAIDARGTVNVAEAVREISGGGPTPRSMRWDRHTPASIRSRACEGGGGTSKSV